MSRSSADSVAPPSPNANAKPANSGVAWRRVAAIARNAFREAVRDRVLYNLVVFALLLIAGAILLGELSAGQEAKIIVDLGLSAILLFGMTITLAIGDFDLRYALDYSDYHQADVTSTLQIPDAR